MKIRSAIILLSFLVCLEAFLTLLLLKQNRNYERTNRELIIQNDSILSVNLELSEIANPHGKQASTYRSTR